MPNKAQLEADYHQRLTTRFSLKDATSGKAVTAHQTFVRLMNVKTKQEVIYVAEEDTAGSYRFDLVEQHLLSSVHTVATTCCLHRFLYYSRQYLIHCLFYVFLSFFYITTVCFGFVFVFLCAFLR